VLSVGDELFQRKCYARMEEFFKGGKTILFVSHDANAINQLCTRAILLDKGECILEGPPKMVTMYYQKMLYAVEGKGEDVRREILELNKNESSKNELYQETEKIQADSEREISDINSSGGEGLTFDRQKSGSADNVTKQQAYYIPGLKPKSTVEYRNYDVDIMDVFISAIDGGKVNNLKTGEKYHINAKVHFKQEFKKLAVGMHIINEKGMVIGSVESTKLSKNGILIDIVNERTYINLKYCFSCALKSGNYFLHIGVSSFSSGEQVVLNRIKDAIMFKVFESKNNVTGGIVDIFDKNNLFIERVSKQ
jgi:lipopolysaccharide transport system ATP-binding protein